jgi:ketose-bisphosphate aldolase
MPIQSMKKMLDDALNGSYAVGYFEPWDQYSMEAVIRAAEEKDSPVIIGCGGIMMNQDWFNTGGMEVLAQTAIVLARRAKIPTAVILNEVLSLEQISRGIEYGFNAVMLDTSDLPFEENVLATRQVVDLAHRRGVDVEAELGHLPIGSGDAAEGEALLTDPDEAAEFIERTGADALSVSIGNVHVLLEGKAQPDLALLERIHEKVKVPLVIHGATGFPDEAVPSVIENGVAKFNVGTVLKKAFWSGIHDAILVTPESENPQNVIGSRKSVDLMVHACNGIRGEVERLIGLYLQNRAQ